MALIKCAECSAPVSQQAKACPHCGRPLKPVPPSGGQRIVAVVVGLLVVWGVVKFEQRASESLPSSAPPAMRVPYRTVQSWAIPNGGYGKVVLIDSTHRNATDLRR